MLKGAAGVTVCVYCQSDAVRLGIIRYYDRRDAFISRVSASVKVHVRSGEHPGVKYQDKQREKFREHSSGEHYPQIASNN